ncbi:MAG: serine/threonine protein kinase [Planctomycetes bacterium]|nr:serine/threonine protein kinase [Planctomycetota bacterium]
MSTPTNDDRARGSRGASQLEQLIFECLERIETEGPAALDSLCAAHPDHATALRARMQALHAAGLIEATPDGAPPFPERLGDFRLLQHLGGGGMGVVYLARQESLGREVALKLIRPEQLFFPGARERFRREVETVARLAHPGIVPIYTVGEEGGIPFFAMERIVGCSLADVIEHLQHEPVAQLTGAAFDRAIAACTGDATSQAPAALFAGRWTEACLRVVREVAEALEHVHRRAVLHRDVKPSNIMLTRSGRVMLVDFGLSSAEGGERLTKAGSQLGSLAYMPPEQLRGETNTLDPRCDVYSLGASLYELLTLRLPFAEAQPSELRRRIAEGAPPPPRGRNPAIDRDVETVCLHAMANDPRQRYATAAEFAHDLTCALEHRPIAARRSSAVERAARWIRRQPAVATALLLAVLLVTVLPSALYLQQCLANATIQQKNVAIEAANQSLDAALQRTQAERQRAEQSLDVAMESIDSMLSRVGAFDLEQVPQFERVRAKLLESALALNERLAAGQGADRPEARAGLAETRRRTGDIYHWLGRFEDALRLLEQALADARALVAAHGGAADRSRLASILESMARTQRALGRREASAEASREAIELLTALPTDASGGVDRLAQLAHALHYRGTTLFLLGQVEPALASHQRAVEVARQVFARAPTADHEATIAAYLGAMGSSQLEHGDNAASAATLREACAIYERVLPHVESTKTYQESYADACTNLGVAHQNERDYDGAAPHHERAFSIYQKLVADYPDSPRYLDSQNAARTNLAALRMPSPATREDGLQLLRDAVVSQQQLVTRFPKSIEYRSQLAMMVGNLGTHEHGTGDAERGCALLDEALDRHRALLAEQPGNPVLQMRSLVFGLKLVHVRTLDGDSRAAWATLQKLEPLVAGDWLTLRRLAGPTLAACAVAQGDAGLTAAEREATAQALLDHGAALMARAIDAGYRDTNDLENEPVFAPLRASTHYPALRAKLAAAAK